MRVQSRRRHGHPLFPLSRHLLDRRHDGPPPQRHCRLLRRPRRLHHRLRDPLHPPPRQVDCPRPKRLQHHQCRIRQRHQLSAAEPELVELGSEGVLLLGGAQCADECVSVVEVTGDEGEDVCGSGYSFCKLRRLLPNCSSAFHSCVPCISSFPSTP